MKNEIIEVLGKELKPLYLDVVDESHLHSRATPVNPETHFRVILVSDCFYGLTKVKRHQMVYSLLGVFFKRGLHALAQQTFTPEEWHNQPKVLSSPKCSHAN